MNHRHTSVPPPPPPGASGPDVQGYYPLTNDQLLELVGLIEEDTEHFGFLLRQNACIELFDHFRVQMNMDHLIRLLFIPAADITVDQLTEYNNYVDAIRRIEKLYRIPMSMPYDRLCSDDVVNEVGNANLTSKRLVNLKKVSPLLHHIDSMDELIDIVGHSTFANLDRDWHNKFEEALPEAGPEGANIPTFPASSSNIPQNEEISQKAQRVNFIKASLWLGRVTKLLNGLFNELGPTPKPENDGPIEDPIQALFLVFINSLVRPFLLEITELESMYIGTQIPKNIQRYICQDHYAIYPEEEAIFFELQSSTPIGHDHRLDNRNKTDLFFYLEDENKCRTAESGTTSDENIKKSVTPITFIEVKAGNLNYFLDGDQRGKLSIDTKQKFKHFSSLLLQCLRYDLDLRVVPAFTIATRHTQIVFFQDKCDSKEEWDSTEHDFAFTDLFLANKGKVADSKDVYGGDDYGVWPLKYIVFQDGIAILKNEATGEDVRVTLQAFYVAFYYQQAKLVKFQRRLERANTEVEHHDHALDEPAQGNHGVEEEVNDIRLPTLSNGMKNLLLYKRFMKLLPKDHILVVKPDEELSEETSFEDDSSKSESSADTGMARGQKRSSEHAFGPSTAEGSKRPDRDEKMQQAKGGNILVSPPTSSESIELIGDDPELPIDVSYRTEFFNTIETKQEFTFEILQNGKDYYTQIFLFTAKDICLFFPSIVKSCPVLAQRPPDEKLVMKVYDHGYWETYLENEYGSSCSGKFELQDLYEERCEEMKHAFETEVNILSRIQEHNRDLKSKRLGQEVVPGDVSDFINAPAVVCFGFINFECLRLNPFDLYGNFMIMEYIESDESSVETKDRYCLSQKLFDEGLHQLKILKHLKIIHGNLRPSNIIISKGKLHLIDFKSGAVEERDDEYKRFEKDLEDYCRRFEVL